MLSDVLHRAYVCKENMESINNWWSAEESVEFYFSSLPFFYRLNRKPEDNEVGSRT